jgi:hypothetical protein
MVAVNSILLICVSRRSVCFLSEDVHRKSRKGSIREKIKGFVLVK